MESAANRSRGPSADGNYVADAFLGAGAGAVVSRTINRGCSTHETASVRPGVEPLLPEPSWYDCCSRHAAASAADPHTGRYPPRRAVVAKYLVPQCNSDRAYSTGNPPYLIYCCRGLTVTLGGRGWPEGMRQAGELFAARSASLKPIGTMTSLWMKFKTC